MAINKITKSIEEKIEDWAKGELGSYKVRFYTKTETINEEIETALKKYPSKSGDFGGNRPDIKCLITTGTLRRIPVMIEVKGKKGDLAKLTADGEVDNQDEKGNKKYNYIQKYAVNGAVHYGDAIIKLTQSYKEVLAIGINGYENSSTKGTTYEIDIYFISVEKYSIPKKVGSYTDLSMLSSENINSLIQLIDDIDLTEEEKENKTKALENEIEMNLKYLNQYIHDDLNVAAEKRVSIVAGMIMAGLGVQKVLEPLHSEDLKGQKTTATNDGKIIYDRIREFLIQKKLPNDKLETVMNIMASTFIHAQLQQPVDNNGNVDSSGESKLKRIYRVVEAKILPLFNSSKYIDLTGKLFNIMTEWIDIPDGDKNDVVLTPRYVTEFMAKLAGVNMNSYVWDYAVGSAGFLVSAMKIMLEDAREKIIVSSELDKKIAEIKYFQLLGVEKRVDIYILAVLNMILMGDGSTNIIRADSLTEFDGNYEQGDKSGEPFPADVFLLNPPYSADGKGFNFVEKALNRMTHGRAAVIIQENAGSSEGLPYTKNILKNNTLLSSIHMSDIFYGKAGVQAAIYLFDIGKPHDVRRKVKFLDFSNDGYTRQNRKKSSSDVNLRNTDHAAERYQEVVDIILDREPVTHFFSKDEYIEDTIGLEGNDWTFMQHKKIDLEPTEEDFRKVVSEYLSWKVSAILKGEISID